MPRYVLTTYLEFCSDSFTVKKAMMLVVKNVAVVFLILNYGTLDKLTCFYYYYYYYLLLLLLLLIMIIFTFIINVIITQLGIRI